MNCHNGRLLLLLSVLFGVQVSHAARSERVPVPVATIYPGDQITADMLVEREFVQLARTQTVLRSMTSLIGKVARKTLLPGQPILADGVRAPHVIKQGVAVLMKYESGGLTITGRGVPLRSAVVGETVELRNPDTGAMVRGLVNDDGSVSVTLP